MLQKICLLLLLTISQLCLAQDVTKDFRNKSISIFKNGTAFFVKSGTVTTDNKVYRMRENLPPALFGTLWVLSPTGELNFLSSYVDTLVKTDEYLATTFSDMLKVNMGKNIRLHLKDQNEVFQGTIMEVPKKSETTLLHLPNACYTLQASGKWVTFQADQIKQIEFLEKPNQMYTLPGKESKPVVQVDFTSTKKEQSLDMLYLSNGLSWTPLYLIELTGDTKARLSLRAEVVNEIEDITNTDVNFVVGVPNFSEANRLSPLIDFTSFGYAYSPYANAQQLNYMNTQYQNANAYGIMEDAASGRVAADFTNLDGSAEEDLFFYTLKNMSLKKGGRGHYPVFNSDIDIAHIYECNLPPNNNNRYAYTDQYLFSVNPNKVIHSIKVNNNTKYPFTTGPALVVKQQGDTKPISQDKLNYTSVGGHSFVKLTEAPDVQISQAEKFIATEENAKAIQHGQNAIYYYDLLTVEGSIKIKNYKDKAIDLNVKRTIMGDLQNSSVKWLTTERVVTAYDPNKTTDVCWETNVKAGEELKIVYT
jgi:hypothetical protein